MTTVVGLHKATFLIDLLSTSIDNPCRCIHPQISFLKHTAPVVRTVTILAMAMLGLKTPHYQTQIPRCGLWWFLCHYGVFTLSMVLARGSFLDSLLSMSQAYFDQSDQQRALEAQWQFTLQTYGLHRPSRDGFLQIFRAVSAYIGPGNPAILAVPVSVEDSPDFVLSLIEQGWNDLRIPGTVVPWQLFPIDSTRAQSGHRALAYPTYIMVSHDDFATFEQRPHGLMEVVVPGDSWLFGTVLPRRVNWPIIREFIAQWCPLGMLVDRLEIMLSGVHLTEQLVECWHGFYARIIITYGGSPLPGLLPFRQLWAPIPHLHHAMMGSTIRKHIVYIPGGTALLFSSTFEALGKENQWFDWLPGAIQASVLLLRPIAFRLLRVNEAIRGELPVCPVDSIHYALIPALTPPPFPIVIVVKVSFPPIMQLGAIFTADRVSCAGLINQLGLANQCMNEGEEPCVCYKNGIPFSNHPIFVHHADFVSCHKGRSYTLVEDDSVVVSDTDSVVAVPPRHTGGMTGATGHCPSGGLGLGSMTSTGSLA